MRLWKLLPAFAVIFLAGGVLATEEPSKVVARVNGAPITEADLALALKDIGPHIAKIPEANRRRVLIDYLINSRLMAQAADDANLDETQTFKERLAYDRQRILKDLYLEWNVSASISEAEARQTYDEQIAGFEPDIEIRARHILVPTESAAREIVESLASGEEFAALASSLSQDSATAEKGGDLGYFTQSQMVEPFAEAAFALETGEVSEPVKSKFGWHVIKVEDKRKQEAPTFDAMKDSIMKALVQQKTGETLRALRRDAEIEIVESKSDTSETPPRNTPKE